MSARGFVVALLLSTFNAVMASFVPSWFLPIYLAYCMLSGYACGSTDGFRFRDGAR